MSRARAGRAVVAAVRLAAVRLAAVRLAAVGLAAVALAATAGCSSGVAHPPATTAGPAAPATTPPPAPTTTTIDPARLPQTRDRPSATGAAFEGRVAALWQAIVDGRPEEARPLFFPLGAYLQVKAIRDPASDWEHRLLAAYDADILAVHQALGAAPGGAAFVSLDVPDAAATWVDPGAEFNKIGYWRVYGSRLRYTVGGQVRSAPVASLISWRGEWYVVHFARIR